MSTATQTTQSTAAAQSARVAALKLDALNVLIPQQDVRTLESSIDIEAASPVRGAIGWIAYRQDRLPVYCLSQQLEPMTTIPSGRRVVVVLQTSARAYGLLCSEVTLLDKLASSVQQLPDAMALPGSPIYALAMHEGALACVSSAARILAKVDPTATNNATNGAQR